MASSKPKLELFDPVRQKWVQDTPEERLRQMWLVKMVEELGFPLKLIAVEKEIASLPHLSHVPPKEIPKRRVDILVFAQNIHPKYSLFPLLMIECKALTLNNAFARQVVGYNEAVQAPFVALANGEEILMGKYEEEKKSYHFENGLWSYSELMGALKK